jgi:hypothetical protein
MTPDEHADHDLKPIDALTDEERELEIARLQEEARRQQAEADELDRYLRERRAKRAAP